MRGCTYRLSRWIALPPSQRETLPIRAPLMTIFALLLEMLGLPVRHTLPVDDLEVLRITLTLLVGRCLRRAGSARQHGRCEKEGHQYRQGPPPRISYEYHLHLPSAHRLALPYCAKSGLLYAGLAQLDFLWLRFRLLTVGDAKVGVAK